MTDEDVAICIVTHNRSGYLTGLLNSILVMSTAPRWVVVIDNASTDDTADVVERARVGLKARPGATELVYQRLPTNTGGAGGFHAATRRGLELGAAWVWLMDDDVEVIPDALERLRPWMSRFQVLHGRRYDVDGSPFFWQAKFNNVLGIPLPYTRRAFTDEGYAITNSGTFEGMMVNAQVVRQIGLPDPRFYISWDDAVYAWLAAQVTEVAYVDEFVLRRTRQQRQVNLGLRHLNDSSSLARYHVMRNRAYVGRYFAAHGALNRPGFAIGTLLTLAKEVFRLVVVEHTLRGFGDLVKGVRDARTLWRDTSWQPMDPADVPSPRARGAALSG